jgi:hypothetical protein
MPHINDAQAIAALDELLKKDISGSWFFKNQMEDYMDDATFAEVQKRLDYLYKKAVVLNNGRAFNPKYRFSRLVDADTHEPKVILLLTLPGNHFNEAKVVGELALNVVVGERGHISLTLPPEAPAKSLAREHSWNASEAELEALNRLIEAARDLQKLQSKHFPVEMLCQKDGIKIQTGYRNPVDQVRAALARA